MISAYAHEAYRLVVCGIGAAMLIAAANIASHIAHG
jgi:hypothetical protein